MIAVHFELSSLRKLNRRPLVLLFMPKLNQRMGFRTGGGMTVGFIHGAEAMGASH